jgi:hypothetical protein
MMQIDDMVDEGLKQIPKLFKIVAPQHSQEVGERRLSVFFSCLIIFDMSY